MSASYPTVFSDTSVLTLTSPMLSLKKQVSRYGYTLQELTEKIVHSIPLHMNITSTSTSTSTYAYIHTHTQHYLPPHIIPTHHSMDYLPIPQLTGHCSGVTKDIELGEEVLWAETRIHTHVDLLDHTGIIIGEGYSGWRGKAIPFMMIGVFDINNFTGYLLKIHHPVQYTIIHTTKIEDDKPPSGHIYRFRIVLHQGFLHFRCFNQFEVGWLNMSSPFVPTTTSSNEKNVTIGVTTTTNTPVVVTANPAFDASSTFQPFTGRKFTL